MHVLGVSIFVEEIGGKNWLKTFQEPKLKCKIKNTDCTVFMNRRQTVDQGNTNIPDTETTEEILIHPQKIKRKMYNLLNIISNNDEFQKILSLIH